MNTYLVTYIVRSEKEKKQINTTIDENEPELIIMLGFEKINITFTGLQHIFKLIKKGIPVITAPTSTFYLKDDDSILDTGAFVKLFEAVSNTNIKIMGKPSSNYFLSGALRLQVDQIDITVIGDDINTDIIGAKRIGCNTMLLRSGKYHQGDEKKCKPCQCVDFLTDIQL